MATIGQEMEKVNDIEKAIAELLIPNGKSSPKMTHALKFIGDGSMQQGLARIADYFAKIGEKTGFKKGSIAGFAAASILFGIGVLIKAKIDKDKQLEAEGKAILQGLEDGLEQEIE